MNRFTYSELGIEIVESDSPDTTKDTVSISLPGGLSVDVENSLRYYPESIQVASTSLGIKKSSKLDFTVMLLKEPLPCAGIFTKSMTASPTVIRNRKVCSSGLAQAIIVNSGNANVFTLNGASDLEEIVGLVADEFNIAKEHIIACSTGVIGVPLPIELFRRGIPGLKNSLGTDKLDEASTAILTTDLGPKVASIKIGDLIICAMAKGAGMIEPNMATMLCYIYTNAKLSAAELHKALVDSAQKSFNSISVDTDTSTSDSVTLLTTNEVEIGDPEIFTRALTAVSVKLARDIVSQGEGVSKIIECCVTTESREYSRRLARKIISSPLVKTAVHGGDPNWGRIVMAIGKPDGIDSLAINPEETVISLQGVTVFNCMRDCGADLKALSGELKKAKRVTIDVRIGSGNDLERCWGCDLTDAYIRINADYTS